MRENPWNELLHSGDKKNQTLQKIKEFYDERNWNISNADIRWLLPVLQDLFTEYPNIDIRSVLDDGKDNIERLAYVLLRLSLLDKLNDSFFNARVSGFFDKMGESKMKVYNVDSALRGDFEKATKEAIRKFLDGDMRYMGFIVLATSLLRYNVFSSHDNIYNFLKDMFRHEMFSSNVPYKNKETESFIDIFSELLKQVIDVNKEKAENLFDGSGDFLRQDIVILRAIKTNNKEVLSAAINHLNNVKTKILERDINKYKDNYIYLLLFAAALSYYLDTYERHEYIKPLIYDLLKPMNNMAPMWYFWADKNDVIAVLRTLLLEQMWHPDGWTLLYDLIHEILTTDYKYAGYFIIFCLLEGDFLGMLRRLLNDVNAGMFPPDYVNYIMDYIAIYVLEKANTRPFINQYSKWLPINAVLHDEIAKAPNIYQRAIAKNLHIVTSIFRKYDRYISRHVVMQYVRIMRMWGVHDGRKIMVRLPQAQPAMRELFDMFLTRFWRDNSMGWDSATQCLENLCSEAMFFFVCGDLGGRGLAA